MKILHISDTHNQHNQVFLPDISDIDMVIHSGDMSGVGMRSELSEFFLWFSNLPIKYKIIIAGNHDKSLDEKFWNDKAPAGDRFRRFYVGAPVWTKEILDNFTADPDHYYLNHELIDVEGIKIFGSPWSVDFHPQYWAYNVPDNEESYALYQQIPEGTDIVVTHGPAFGILDLCASGHYAGSKHLRERIKTIKPKFHLFGHIHEAYGRADDENTTYLNGSVLNLDYDMVNIPHVFEI